MSDTCFNCGKRAPLEATEEDIKKGIHEGECCKICGEWFCDDCIDFTATNYDFMCKECAKTHHERRKECLKESS